MAGLRDTNTEAPVGFEEGMRAAEEAAGIPSDEELYGPQFATPEPDETGRVPSPSPPRDEEGNVLETEAPVDEPVEEPEVEEETPAAVPMVPPDEIAELKRKMGELLNDNAELRRWQQEQQQAYQPQPQLDGNALAWFDEIVEQAPDQAAVWAAQQQQPLLYERAIRSWFDVDPVAAARYERSMEWNQLQSQMTAQFAPQIEGAQNLAQQADLQAALKTVQARHDDFDQVVGALDEASVQRIVESEFPTEILNGLAGGRQEKEKVLETLYRWAKSEQAPALVQGAVEAVEQAREDARASKRAATVASATTTTPPPVEETEGERLMRVWKEQRPSMRDAWTGR